MKLKRYTAPDIRQAMTKVRNELGPDAVILSNRKTDGGIEIIAAMDYDDSIVKTPLQTTEEKKQTAIQSSSRNQDLAEHLTKTVMKDTPRSPQWKKALDDTYEPAPLEATTNVIKKAPKETTQSVIKAVKKKPPVTPKKQPEVSSQVSEEWVQQLKTAHEIDEVPSDIPMAISSKEQADDLKNVWGELSNLRGLLETQLSSLAWSDASKRKPIKTKILKHFLELGLTPAVSYQLLDQVDDNESFESCWRKGLALFAKQIPIINEDIVNTGGTIALVGPTGVGKTTTIAKLAARYALKHGTDSIALVTTDNYRIGAQEQLKTYGRILGTPVKVANNAEELRNILKSLYDKDLILIDTAGMSQRDIKLTEQFSMLSEGSILIKSYLVVSASSQQQVLDETVLAYKKAFLDGCIITKLDETLSLGGALATLSSHKLPISYTSDGQRVPEDLHRASAIELVKTAVKMMNQAKIELDDSVVELAYGGIAANDLS